MNCGHCGATIEFTTDQECPSCRHMMSAPTYLQPKGGFLHIDRILVPLIRPAENKTQTELRALESADEILEAAQSYLRGATRVKEIREAIYLRIKELQDEP